MQMKKNWKKEKNNKMKVYKYDDICMIAIKKDTKNKLLKLKQKHNTKNIDVIIKILIQNYEKYNS